MIVCDGTGWEQRSLYWGVVTDNTDFAMTVHVRMLPTQLFDRTQTFACGGHELCVGWTNTDVLAEHLRIGHPPRPDEEDTGKGKGKGKRTWYHPRVLRELALLM